MAKLVSKAYGDALFEITQDMGSIDATYEEVLTLQSIWQERSDLMQLLNHPQIIEEGKIQVVRNVSDGKVSDGVMGFLVTIVDKGRQQSIPDIFAYFIDKVKEYKKIGTAYVISAAELNEAQKSQAKERLLTATVYREFEMDYTVNESLIDGMATHVGDRAVDSSIKTQLYKLKKDLLGVQVM